MSVLSLSVISCSVTQASALPGQYPPEPVLVAWHHIDEFPLQLRIQVVGNGWAARQKPCELQVHQAAQDLTAVVHNRVGRVVGVQDLVVGLSSWILGLLGTANKAFASG